MPYEQNDLNNPLHPLNSERQSAEYLREMSSGGDGGSGCLSAFVLLAVSGLVMPILATILIINL